MNASLAFYCRPDVRGPASLKEKTPGVRGVIEAVLQKAVDVLLSGAGRRIQTDGKRDWFTRILATAGQVGPLVFLIY